jgi:hypothetical protein
MKLFQFTKRDGSNLGQPMTGEQINETLLAALEEITLNNAIIKKLKLNIKQLEAELEEERQENASLRSGDDYERGAE